MNTNIITTILIISILLTGCTSNGLSHSQLRDTESLLIKSNDKGKLVSFYRKHLDDDKTFKMELIKIYLEQKDLNSAKIYIDTLDEDEQADYRVNALLASYYYRMGDLESATKKLKYARKKAKNKTEEAELYALSGKLDIAEHDLVGAKNNLKKAMELGYDQAIVKNNLAIIAVKEKRLDDALELLSTEYQMNAKDKDIATNLAIVLMQKKYPEKAKSILIKTFGEANALLYYKKLNHPTQQGIVVKRKPINIPKPVVAKEEPKENLLRKILNLDDPMEDLTGKYEIQVLAKHSDLNERDSYLLKSINRDWLVFDVGEYHKYCLGPYDSIDEAKITLNNIGINEAFIVNYEDKYYKKLTL